MFLEVQSYPDTTQYNLPMHVEMDRQEDAKAISEAWKKFIRTFAVLRNRFTVDEEGTPLQWPDDDMPVEIPVRQMTEAEAKTYIHRGFVRPWDAIPSLT